MPLKRAAILPYRVTSPGRSLELETTAYLLRISAAGGASPTNNVVVAIDDFVRAAKAHGYWALRDVIGLFAVPDLATAFVNLKSSSFPFAAGGGAPSLLPYKGLSFNGTSDYIKFGFTPSSYGGLYTLNSSNMSVWTTSYTSTGYYLGNNNTRLGYGSLVYGSYNYRVSQGSTASVGGGNAADRPSGMISLNRASSASAELYHEGALNYSGAVASSSLDTQSFFLGGNIAGTFAACTIPYVAIGGALTAQQIQQERDDVAALLRAVGALPNAAWLPIGSYAANGSLIGGIGFALENAGQPWSLQRDGASYVRIELRPGDRWSVDAANEPGASRSELDSGSATPFATGTTGWVGFDWFIEPGFIPSAGNTGVPFVIGQQLHSKSGETGPVPALTWEISGTNVVCCTSNGTNKTVRFTTPVVAAAWYRIVYSVVPDPSNGSLTIWLNGTQVVSLTGIPIGQASDAVYPKFGVYCSGSIITSPFAVRYANMTAGTASLAGLVTAPGPLPALVA